MDYSFQRYLNAKRTVDDRALNRTVWQTMLKQLEDRSSTQPLQVIEIGAGTGTMLHRLVEWGALKRGTYLGIDSDATNIQSALSDLPAWVEAQGLACTPAPDGFDLSGREFQLRASFQTREVANVVAKPGGQGYDLLVANAFLDLVDPSALLTQFGQWMLRGGLGYFSINFDGLTHFEPQLDPELEEKIIGLYHQSMDDRRVDGQPTGGSQTGRHLYNQLRASGWELIAAGASDWVVHPVSGGYPADEAYFLTHILHFFEVTLAGNPELDPLAFQRWLAARRQQIKDAELFFVVHQLDYLARWPFDDPRLPGEPLLPARPVQPMN